jgi:hypothetical protein
MVYVVGQPGPYAISHQRPPVQPSPSVSKSASTGAATPRAAASPIAFPEFRFQENFKPDYAHPPGVFDIVGRGSFPPIELS